MTLRAASTALLLLIHTTLACAAFSVKSDFDPEADFGALETWRFMEPPTDPEANPFADNPLLRKRVRNAVTANLEAKGFGEPSTAEVVDFLVTFHVTLEERSISRGGGCYGYSYSRHGYPGCGPYYEYRYQQGTLIVDVISPDGEQLLWRGWVSGAVPTVDTDRDRISAAVTAMMERFPPPQ